MMTRVKTDQEINAMRDSGRMLATVLDILRGKVCAGITTKDLAEIAKAELKPLGGIPTFLGMYGFPDVLCVSVNDEVVHGIPSTKKLISEGDIVSMDFGVTYKGMITDSAISVIIGQTSERHLELVKQTELAMYAGVSSLHHGIKTGDIAASVQSVLDKHHLGIVRDLVGHGVGHELHEDPNIPNYGKKGTGLQLAKGMTIAIEPMATVGDHRVSMDSDGWTVRTKDGSYSAHFEHTVLITQDGAEILTQL